ncbi:hypothetical protein PEBR_31486 [Penicillium brasilianum]|uniref:CFEM domain-containing protein n=1 Tax=Penicillium brasilianum TaxID=104259 RepID=A0A1S9RHW1_PENBI|nr:hypothetical protein PEBR_31486 [Penicillium brasilianum]
MKLVLAWLLAALVSPIGANTLYNLTHEFPDDCAVFCTGTTFVHGWCDVDSVACWCQTPDFLSDFGCCIAYVCDEDIKSEAANSSVWQLPLTDTSLCNIGVKTTFDDWCSAASVEGPTNNITDCAYPYATGTPSGSSSGSSSTTSQSSSSQAKFGSIPGKVIGGAVVACFAGLFLSLALVFYWFRLSKKQKQRWRRRQQQESPPTERLPTPPPPYSESRQIPHLNRSAEGSPTPYRVR